MSKSVDRYIVLHAIRNRCTRFLIGTQLRGIACLVGCMCIIAVRDCRHLQLNNQLRTYWTNRGLFVVWATLILLQAQLRLTCLDEQHEGTLSAFAGLVRRQLQDRSFPGLQQLCCSELVLPDQQLCSCRSCLFLPDSSLENAIDITAQDTRKQCKLVLDHTFIVLLLCVMQAVDTCTCVSKDTQQVLWCAIPVTTGNN